MIGWACAPRSLVQVAPQSPSSGLRSGHEAFLVSEITKSKAPDANQRAAFGRVRVDAPSVMREVFEIGGQPSLDGDSVGTVDDPGDVAGDPGVGVAAVGSGWVVEHHDV